MSSRLLFALLLLGLPGSTIADPPAPEAEAAWNGVQGAFDKREWVLAVVEGEDFVRRYPKSGRAAQAAYQSGCAYLLMQKTNEANEAFKRLASNHFDSPWALLALQLHMDAATLLGLADDLRSQGKTKRAPALTERAAGLYVLFGQRFANDNRTKGEVVYKWADCARRLGKEAEAATAIQNLTRADQGDWSKLAAFRLGARDKFQAQMSDLLDLATNGEERALFLELADRFQQELPKDARLQCQYLRGHCVEGAERLTLFRGLCQDQFDSPWAGEAAFFLAEHAFEKGKYAEAQEVYRALAARHANGPRAKRLTAWATWIDQHAEDQKELQRLVVECLNKFDGKKGGVGVTLNIEADTLPFPIDARIAYCDRQVLLRASLGDVGFACGLQRPNVTWYRFLNQATMQRVEKSALPILTFKVNEFPKGSVNFQWALAMNQDPAAVCDIEIDPAVGAIVAAKLTQGKHFHRQPKPDGSVDFIFEWPHRNPNVEQTLTVQFSKQGSLHQMNYQSSNGAGKKFLVVAKDLVFGEPIPREQFAMPNQPGIEVRHLQQVNPWEIFAQMMNLFGPTYQTLVKELPKNH